MRAALPYQGDNLAVHRSYILLAAKTFALE